MRREWHERGGECCTRLVMQRTACTTYRSRRSSKHQHPPPTAASAGQHGTTNPAHPSVVMPPGYSVRVFAHRHGWPAPMSVLAGGLRTLWWRAGQFWLCCCWSLRSSPSSAAFGPVLLRSACPQNGASELRRAARHRVFRVELLRRRHRWASLRHTE